MSYKYRLFIFTLLISFIPLLNISLFSYYFIRLDLIKNNTKTLEVVADTVEERVNKALNQYLNQAELFSYRLQIGKRLNDYYERQDAQALSDTMTLLRQSSLNEGNINKISLYNNNGGITSSTGSYDIAGYLNSISYLKAQNSFQLTDIFKDESGKLLVKILGPVFFEGKRVGFIEFIDDANLFTDITDIYYWLGDTGEIFLLKSTSSGDAIFLTPLRFDKNAALTKTVSKENKNTPSIVALKKQNETLIDWSLTDYKGTRVFAITRYIDALDWSIVAKINQQEVFSSGTSLIAAFSTVFLVTFIILIVGVLLYTRMMTRPVNELTDIAKRLRQGDFSARVEVKTAGELGILSKTFNEMAAELQEIYKNLEQKVKDRTKTLESLEAEKEAMLSNIGEGVMATDNQGRILFINSAARGILGFQENEKLIGKYLTKTVKMLDEGENPIENDKRPMSSVLESGKPYTQTALAKTLYYLDKKNNKIPIAFIITPIKLKKKMVGTIEVFRDITKEKEVDRAKTEFVSLASHQLRTPLTAISWYSEMLLSGDAGQVTEEQKSYLEEINKGNKRMIELVQALLNVSRVDMGTISINTEPADVIEIMRNVLDDLKPLISKNEIKISEAHEDIPIIPVDKKLMGIIYLNLISNAVKYSNKGGIVEIRHYLKKTGDVIDKDHICTRRSILITVSDSGMGIPAGQQNKIFSKLFRADNAKTSIASGTGLGLYLVKSVVERLKGTVWFISEENKGSTFYVILPTIGIKTIHGNRALE